jgi:hypothetical protein
MGFTRPWRIWGRGAAGRALEAAPRASMRKIRVIMALLLVGVRIRKNRQN